MANKSNFLMGIIFSMVSTLITVAIAAIGIVIMNKFDNDVSAFLSLFVTILAIVGVIFLIISWMISYREGLREQREKQILEEYPELFEELEALESEFTLQS